MTQQSRSGSDTRQRPLGERIRRGFHRRRVAREQRRREIREDRAQRRLRRRDRRATAAARRSRTRRDPLFVTLSRSWRIRIARRKVRRTSRGTRSILPETSRARWRRWRGQRHATRAQRVPRTIVPTSTMTRWRRWRWKRHTAQAQRPTRSFLPESWRKRWLRWTAGAEKRVERRREIYASLVPAPIRMRWTKLSLLQRSRIRRTLLGSTLVVVISFGAYNCAPTRAIPGARFIKIFTSGDDYSAYTNLVRPPNLDVPELTTGGELLRPARTVPRNPPRLKCGSEAFQSALGSAEGTESVRSILCAGNYGIGRIRREGTPNSSPVGFFAVDVTGRWRLVSTVPGDDDLEATFPDGFPESLLDRWEKR